jgi:hypothetical protein
VIPFVIEIFESWTGLVFFHYYIYRAKALGYIDFGARALGFI